MKIIDIQCYLHTVKQILPIKTRFNCYPEMNVVQLKIITEGGVEGECFFYGFGPNGHYIVAAFIHQQLKPLLLGLNALNISQIWCKAFDPIRHIIGTGLLLFVFSAIDIALWDIQAKYNNVSLNKLSGSTNKPVKLYGSGGWIGQSDSELIDECNWYFNKGIKSYKIRVGDPRDLNRLQLLRNNFGDKIDLFADANRVFSINEAIECAAMLADFNVKWLEEPLVQDSILLYQNLHESSPIPIAAGENLAFRYCFNDLCEISGVSVIQPDIARCGGVTEFIHIAECINKNKCKLATHLMPELSIQLINLCGDNIAEYIPIIPEDILQIPLKIIDGYAIPPESIGANLELNVIGKLI